VWAQTRPAALAPQFEPDIIRPMLPALLPSYENLEFEPDPPRRLNVSRLQGIEDFDAIAAEWDALDAEILPRTPFTSRLWNSLWWQHMRRDNLAVRDEFHSYVIRDQFGRLIAVAPMMLTSRPAIGPLRARELHFFCADANLTEIRGLVCRSRHHLAAVDALLEAISSEGSKWSWAYLSGLRPLDSEAVEAAATASATPALAWACHIPCYFLRLNGAWEQFKARLPRNTKEALRKCYNSLKRDGLRFEFEAIRDPLECDAALSHFFKLHRQRARCEDASIRHPDKFRALRSRRFLRAYAFELSQRDQLRIFQIRIEGRVAATRVGFQFDDEVYLYCSGYDTRWRKYSLMTTVIAEAIRWCIDQNVAVVNLSTGTDRSKTRWRPECSMHSDAIARAPGLAARLAFLASQALLPRLRLRAPAISADTGRS
jgi:CelD/BcsL family acetyltransferase involved in cellulose biosynthesis